jgi:hypothetical protein
VVFQFRKAAGVIQGGHLVYFSMRRHRRTRYGLPFATMLIFFPAPAYAGIVSAWLHLGCPIQLACSVPAFLIMVKCAVLLMHLAMAKLDHRSRLFIGCTMRQVFAGGI